MSNRVVNNIELEGNKSSKLFFSKLCNRFGQRAEDKLSKIPAVLWQNSHKGTIAWSKKNMKCNWAVVEETKGNKIKILSGETPAFGIQDRIFSAAKKFDDKVVLINEHTDNENNTGTRILYREYTIEDENRTGAEEKLHELIIIDIEEGDYNAN